MKYLRFCAWFGLVLSFYLTLVPAGFSATSSNYTQTSRVMGIEIKAPASVNPEALKRAEAIVTQMLQARADMARRMADKKAAIGIIPKEAFITALPEFAKFSGKKDSNGNPYDSFSIRGAGAVNGQPVTAASEENLLKLPHDPFAQESVLHHEFAHAIMNLGFAESERLRWMAIYQAAAKAKLFPGAFALTNADEYWAELSQSYFGVNNEINGPDLIRSKDPAAFEFLLSVYGPAKVTPSR